MKKMLTIIVTFVIIILLILCCALGFLYFSVDKDSPEIAFQNAYQSVVEVKAVSEDIGESFGSGVVIDKDGLILTNAHVVSYFKINDTYEYNETLVRFADENDYISCNIVKTDYDADLALLKIASSAVDCKPIEFTKEKYSFGTTVYAIGNISNYGLGISCGTISAPEVNVKYDEKNMVVIQADISISHGNSGGALIDNKGNLIGITTFRTKDESGKINYGFAYSIPVSTINEFLNK